MRKGEYSRGAGALRLGCLGLHISKPTQLPHEQPAGSRDTSAEASTKVQVELVVVGWASAPEGSTRTQELFGSR